MEQQQIEISSNMLSTQTMVSHNTQNQQMKFETELIPRFRGRLLSEYIPKKQNKKDGTKSCIKKPNYFSDLHNRHYLNLLV